jgi:signal transduction histidine kinase
MGAAEKVNILMVDDQPAKLLTYEAILSELGENLIKATSGSEALEQLLKNEVAIVLLDVNMPGLDGFELAKMIHLHPRYERTAIIFISAVHVTDIDRLSGFERGAVDYISVPVVPQLLRARVRVFVDLYRKARELERVNAELRHVSGQLLKMQDDERRHIARELHDGLGQELAATKMVLAEISQCASPSARDRAVNEANEIVERAIQQVRSMSHLLHPPLLDEVGLLSAVRCYLDGLTNRGGIATALEVQPVKFPRLSSELETAIFRIIQEAITNVFRHSGAKRAWVTLSTQGERVAIKIADDGRGISPEIAEMRPDNVGIGLAGMKQRAREFGGQLQITNTNPGTLVEVVIPAEYPLAQGERATA